MAKKNETTPAATDTKAEPTPPVENAKAPDAAEMPEEKMETSLSFAGPPQAEEPKSALATTPAAGSDEFQARKALASRLPESMRGRALMTKRPTATELMDIVMSLPESQQEAMVNLVSKTNPEKQGLHSASSGFDPTALKVYHGTGNDPARPRQTLTGQFYSSDSRVIGEKFNAAVLAIYEGQTLWPQQGSGAANESKAPICQSMDRQMGSKYGPCSSCALNPRTRAYTQGGCSEDVTVYLLDQDFTAIYELKFSKTSLGAGRSLMNVLKKENQVWDRWFTVEAKERVEGKNKWYVVQCSPLADPAKVNTPKTAHPLFQALSKVIDTDVYYRKIADIYDRAKNSADVGAAGAATENAAFDEKAFLKGETSATPDYSKDV